MESPLAVLSAAAHYVEQMEQLKLSGSVGSSMGIPPLGSLSSPHAQGPPMTLLVPCANGILVPYVQQPGPYFYPLSSGPLSGSLSGPLHPVPPNKLTLSPMSPSSSLSSPVGSLGSALSSAVSTPTEERHILLPRINHEELQQKLQLHQTVVSPAPSVVEITRENVAREIARENHELARETAVHEISDARQQRHPQSIKLNQTQLNQAQLGQAQLAQAPLTQAQLSPAQLSQAQLGPAQLSQTQLGQTQLGQAQIATSATLANPTTQKVVLRRKKPSANNIEQSVENHFRRSLGSNYKDIKISEQPSTSFDPAHKKIRRRPHSVFVSEEVDRHFERSLGVDAWQTIQAKRAKFARKTWN